MKKTIYPFRVFAVLMIALVVSCNKTDDLSTRAVPVTKSYTPGLVRISFDAEALKLRELSNPEKANAIELTDAAPRADR